MGKEGKNGSFRGQFELGRVFPAGIFPARRPRSKKASLDKRKALQPQPPLPNGMAVLFFEGRGGLLCFCSMYSLPA